MVVIGTSSNEGIDVIIYEGRMWVWSSLNDQHGCYKLKGVVSESSFLSLEVLSRAMDLFVGRS